VLAGHLAPLPFSPHVLLSTPARLFAGRLGLSGVRGAYAVPTVGGRPAPASAPAAAADVAAAAVAVAGTPPAALRTPLAGDGDRAALPAATPPVALRTQLFVRDELEDNDDADSARLRALLGVGPGTRPAPAPAAQAPLSAGRPPAYGLLRHPVPPPHTEEEQGEDDDDDDDKRTARLRGALGLPAVQPSTWWVPRSPPDPADPHAPPSEAMPDPIDDATVAAALSAAAAPAVAATVAESATKDGGAERGGRGERGRRRRERGGRRGGGGLRPGTSTERERETYMHHV
jgi:hypothetical protein